MFRASAIFNAPTMLLAGYRPAALSVHYTTSCKLSSAPEDGRNYRPKHAELIGIINKPLLLHLLGCLHYCMPAYTEPFGKNLFSPRMLQSAPKTFSNPVDSHCQWHVGDTFGNISPS